MKIALIKQANGFLKPYSEFDFEALKKIKANEIFEVEYKQSRNIKFHRKMFSLFNLAFENQSDYRSLDEMRYDLTIVSGYYDEYVNLITGEIYKKAKSISFASMDETEFSEYYEKVKETICKWLGITNEQIEEEIQQYF